MAQLVADCPRCGSRQMTFDVPASKCVSKDGDKWHEVFGVCRNCGLTTIFVLTDSNLVTVNTTSQNGWIANFGGVLNTLMDVDGFVSVKDAVTTNPPEFLPNDVNAVFIEGATCLAVHCYNAAGTMFRLCVDLATRPLLPTEETAGLNGKTRRDLGLRLPWLFDTGRLPESLRDLSSCIKEDGNDGAHRGTLTEADATDLLDFTFALLNRIYTEPERLKRAKERRDARRQSK